MSIRYLRVHKKFIARCRSRRDRETVCRLVKEICILDHDFESAAFYRELQHLNLPRSRSLSVRARPSQSVSLSAASQPRGKR